FTFVVDDFGIKYVGKESAQFLVNALKENYTISVDWEGKKYVGLKLDWDYDKREVLLSMPGYMVKALKRFGHDKPRWQQDQPHEHTPPVMEPNINSQRRKRSLPPLAKKSSSMCDR
ncbi:hypothetical protein ACHAW6_003292, partial [Cyclotella cf. meneghiniana]